MLSFFVSLTTMQEEHDSSNNKKRKRDTENDTSSKRLKVNPLFFSYLACPSFLVSLLIIAVETQDPARKVMAPKAGTQSKMNIKGRASTSQSSSTKKSNTKKPKIRVPTSVHGKDHPDPAVKVTSSRPADDMNKNAVQRVNRTKETQKAGGELISRVHAGKVTFQGISIQLLLITTQVQKPAQAQARPHPKRDAQRGALPAPKRMKRGFFDNLQKPGHTALPQYVKILPVLRLDMLLSSL